MLSRAAASAPKPSLHSGSDELSVDLDLKAAVNVEGIGDFDLDIDVDFDLKFSCSGGVIAIQTKNLEVGVDVDGGGLGTDLLVAVAKLLSVDLGDGIADNIADELLPDSQGVVPFLPEFQCRVRFSFLAGIWSWKRDYGWN